MTQDPKPRRIRERLELKLPVRVLCRETLDFEWVEVTRLIDVTPFGAGFTLKRPVDKGRLLHMTIPMPRQLRVFDHIEDQYKVWALVRYAIPTTPKDGNPSFEVGVAFVGKRPPKSYEENPSKRYEIAESATDIETLSEDAEDVLGPLVTGPDRVETRYNIAVDMLLEIIDEKGAVVSSENTVTENISHQGATLFTSLAIPIGRFVRLSSQQYNTTLYAAVRAASTGPDGIPRIHVQFIDREWPL